LDFLPVAVQSLIARTFPIVEGALAVALLADPGSTLLLLASALFGGFAALGVLVLGRKNEDSSSPSCGCLGKFAELQITPGSVALNASLSLGGIWVGLTHIGGSTEPAVLAMAMSLSVLIAATYWLASYAFSVLARVSKATDERLVL
jgi:hypothetical protein